MSHYYPAAESFTLASYIFAFFLISYTLFRNSQIKQFFKLKQFFLESRNAPDTQSRQAFSGKNIPGLLFWQLILLYGVCIGFVEVTRITSQFLLQDPSLASSIQSKTQKSEKSEATDPESSVNRIEILKPHQVTTKFRDIAGLLEPKHDVRDIIEYLKNPLKFTRLGAKPPKGMLLYGPPGTGKTLLARAIAGESGVTFLAVSGSQFEQEYVGVGASRVRQLFQLARKHAPAIIFIDEIDSVASKRQRHDISSTIQTLNQLLTEMDGLNPIKNAGIIVIGASNRLEALDPAILRPGRFDRQIALDLPNPPEREEILNLYAKTIKISPSVNLKQISKLSVGFSGADLANLVNEAAIHATQKNKSLVDAASFEFAKDKMVLGNTKSSMQLTPVERKIIAYHEAGHAIVGHTLKNHDALYKVTILPRGKSLGHTSFEPLEDRYLHDKAYLENKIATQLAGRIAEELIFGPEKITTGAASDFSGATQIAYHMVTQWGFSKKIGPLVSLSGATGGELILDKPQVESEVREIINRNLDRARSILLSKKTELNKLANALLEHETLSQQAVSDLLSPPASKTTTAT